MYRYRTYESEYLFFLGLQSTALNGHDVVPMVRLNFIQLERIR
jgi:hypothetical protein